MGDGEPAQHPNTCSECPVPQPGMSMRDCRQGQPSIGCSSPVYQPVNTGCARLYLLVGWEGREWKGL